jgi:hypothetical protein
VKQAAASESNEDKRVVQRSYDRSAARLFLAWPEAHFRAALKEYLLKQFTFRRCAAIG